MYGKSAMNCFKYYAHLYGEGIVTDLKPTVYFITFVFGRTPVSLNRHYLPYFNKQRKNCLFDRKTPHVQQQFLNYMGKTVLSWTVGKALVSST